jgi:hypothetical protein
MPCRLVADCLNCILEYLEHDKNTLYSCLLVNRKWCGIAVRILWKDVWNLQDDYNYKSDVSLSIISTLIACLPKESKDSLQKEKFFIIPPTRKPPLFNYPSFIKVITIYGIYRMIQRFPSDSRGFVYYYSPWYRSRMHSCLLLELLKMFMCQVSSLKFLDYYSGYNIDNIIEFIYIPEAKFCLGNLTELWCRSDICSDFFYQMSQICHNIQSLTIKFVCSISDGLTVLISSQKNLKSISLEKNDDKVKDIIPSLTKFSLTLTELVLDECYSISLSFVSIFKNLQVLCFSNYSFNDFDRLQYVHFSQLKVLKFVNSSPKTEMFVRFLETNGKNLTELYISENRNNSLNSAIAKFCPNLRILSLIFEEDEFDTFKIILNNCQYLEIIRFQYDVKRRPNYKTFFNVLAKYAQNNFYELSMDWHYLVIHISFQELYEELEEFFTNWKDRIPQKSLSLVITNCYGNSIKFEKYMKMMIENYTKKGIISKFRTTEHEEF